MGSSSEDTIPVDVEDIHAVVPRPGFQTSPPAPPLNVNDHAPSDAPAITIPLSGIPPPIRPSLNRKPNLRNSRRKNRQTARKRRPPSRKAYTPRKDRAPERSPRRDKRRNSNRSRPGRRTNRSPSHRASNRHGRQSQRGTPRLTEPIPTTSRVSSGGNNDNRNKTNLLGVEIQASIAMRADFARASDGEILRTSKGIWDT